MTLVPATDQPGIRCPTCARAQLTVPHDIPDMPDEPDTRSHDDVVAVCPACGHRAHASLVAEATWLAGEQQQLLARLSWVQGRIAAGDTTPTGWVVPGWAGAPAPTPGRPVQPSPPPRPSLTAQTLLLAGGALLLVIATVVFAAVAWDRLGAGGQVGLLVVVVGVLAASAHGLRHSYRSTAQTLAAVAAAVAAVGLVAAPRLGLGPPWLREHDAAWGAVAMLGVVALSAAFTRISDLRAWRLAAVVAAVLAGWAACLAASGQRGGAAPLAVGALVVVGAVVLVLARRSVPPTADTVRADLVLAGTGLVGVAVVLSLTGYGDSPATGRGPCAGRWWPARWAR